jgi:tripartite-type tricarboxylate transporter receptor subunit TctC
MVAQAGDLPPAATSHGRDFDMNRIHVLAAVWCAVLALVLHDVPARAQSYPSQPVKLIVPFPAGSATDNVARIIGKELQESLGQPFIIDNRPGAQAMIGTEMVAKSTPDGYTILVAAVSFAATESMFKKVPFDAVKDFTPVSRIVTTPLALMVKADFPAHTPREFVDYLKARPGKLSAGYGSSSSQVCIAQLESLAKVDVLAVPYKGIPLAVNDVLSGVLQFTFVDLGNAIAQAKGGNMRAIAVTSEKRSPLVPDWPALSETLPGFDIDAWIATLGPRGLPAEIAEKLHAATVKALSKPEVQAKLATVGFTPALLGPKEGVPFMKAEVVKWAKLAKQAGIVPE